MIRPLTLAALGAMLWGSGAAHAHDVELTRIDVNLSAERFEVEFYYDVNAWILGVRPEHLTPEDLDRLRAMPVAARLDREDELRRMLRRGVKIRFDECPTDYTIDFADNPNRPTSSRTSGLAVPRIARLHGALPRSAATFDLWTSKMFGDLVLMIVEGDRVLSAPRLIERGTRSPNFPLARSTEQSGWIVARQYLVLGFEHILPRGLDHILFVLGLFLLSPSWRPLLWQVTAFTLAHSVTLALSTYGVLSLSPRVVEPLIALSITAVALENVFTSRLHAWRPMVVFAFGLLHGLGFAGVLTELGLPRGQFVPALVAFNVGVELGQLAVIGLALTAVGWFQARAWYRPRVAIPASVVIAATGLWWTMERAMGWIVA